MGLLSLLGWGRQPDPEARAYLRDPVSNPQVQAGPPLGILRRAANLALLPAQTAPPQQWRPRAEADLPPFPLHTLSYEARNERLPDVVRPNSMSAFPDAMSYALAGQRPPHTLPSMMRANEPSPSSPWYQPQQEAVQEVIPDAVSRNALPAGAPALNRGLAPAAARSAAEEKTLQENADAAAWEAALQRGRAQIAQETRAAASLLPRPGRPVIAQLFPRSTRSTPSR